MLIVVITIRGALCVPRIRVRSLPAGHGATSGFPFAYRLSVHGSRHRTD